MFQMLRVKLKLFNLFNYVIKDDEIKDKEVEFV